MTRPAFVWIAATSFALAACNMAADQAGEPPAAMMGGASPHAAGGSASGMAGAVLAVGTVTEAMSSGGYTYVEVDDGAKKVWAAAPQFEVEVGDRVVVPNGMPMQDFESKTLNRRWDVVYFVNAIEQEGVAAASKLMEAHGGFGTPAAASAVDLEGIKKAEGGHTVGELFANKSSLAGKEVAIRGKVTKYNSGIMGKNWLHIQDGTGAAGSNDLTVTTKATAAVGNTVLVRGKAAINKDFGAGYTYEVIVEDAAITIE